MKRAICYIFLLLTVVFSACDKDDDEEVVVYTPNLDTPRVTTLVYFTGTSLRSFFNQNLADMESAVAAGALGNYGGLVMLWVKSSSTAELVRLAQCGDECYKVTLKEYSAFESLSKESVQMVLEDTKELMGLNDPNLTFDPALNMIISGHGTGWVPYGISGAVLSAKGYYDISNPDEMWENNSGIITRYMGSDKDGKMNISEFVEGVESSGTHFGYMLFDACLMSNVETLYRLRNVTDYVVASPAEVMGDGFPYSVTIQNLFLDSGLRFDLPAVCLGYYNSYLKASYNPYATVAYCVTSELEALAQEIKLLPNTTDPSVSTLQYYEGLSPHIYYDLKQYVEESNPDSDLTAFTAQFNKAFPEDGRYHTTKFYTLVGSSGAKLISYYGGVSTSAPTTSQIYLPYWEQEPWAIAVSD